MVETFKKAERLAAHVEEYINTKVDFIKLGAAEKASLVFSNIIATTIVFIVVFFFVVFGSVAAAYALAGWTGKISLGFLIVAGFYLLLGIIIWTVRERLIRVPIMNNIIGQLFKDEKADDNENE